MRYTILLALWLIADLVLFVASFALAYVLRVGLILSTDFPLDRFLRATIFTAPVWLLVMAATRTFALTRRQWSVRNIAYVAYAALIGVALFTLVYYFRFTQFFSRLLLIEAFAITTAVVFLWHVLFDQILRRMLRKNPPQFPLLVIGITRESRSLIARLNRRRSPLTPVAILDAAGVKESAIEGVPVLGRYHKLEEVLEKFRITHVLQCSDLEQSLNLLSACRNRGIIYMLMPSVLGIVERDESVESLEGWPVTVVRPGRRSLDHALT